MYSMDHIAAIWGKGSFLILWKLVYKFTEKITLTNRETKLDGK
jgi:hypothetical protein